MSITFYAATYEAARNCFVPVEQDDRLNVSNTNGREILESLDLEFVDGGLDPIDINDFIARCRTYVKRVKGFDEPELPSHTSRSLYGPTIIECGRSENYLKTRIAQLLMDCEAGLKLNATHVYAC